MNVLNERITRITAKTIIVGIDAAKEIHWARITDYRGIDLSKPIKVHNSMDGFENLLAKIENLLTKHGCDQVVIGMEPSGHYWRAFGWYLKLHESEPVVVGVNPYHTKQAKELNDNSQTKSDPKDALVVAHLIREGRYFDTYLPEDEYAELRQLNTERQRIMKQVSRANNILIALLDEFFPEYATVWSDVTCPTSLELLKIYAFPSDITSAPHDKLLKDIRMASNGKEGIRLMEKMIRAANRSIGVKEGLRAVRLRMLSLIDELHYFEDKKADVEAKLEAVMDTLQLGKVLQSMLGVGPIISAAFLGEVGDISRFTNWKQVRSLAGLNLVENSSGQHKGKTKVSKRGRPYLRHMLFMAGECGCRCNPEMNALYRYLRDRKNNPLKAQQAFVAVGLKIMRILFHMAKTGETYDPGKALGTVRLQQIASLA
ncbi:MAG: IS110 family transposase [Oscillospiraceae bacterium]|jgi:transposase|nr:IS110 family transposase [Oscillospiraceae bacterium]